MVKAFYDDKNKEINFEGHKTKLNFNKIKKDIKGDLINLEESNSTLLKEKILNNQKNKNDGYIYYGNNKIFKIKNSNLSSQNISNKLKTQNLFFKINNINNNFTKNFYNKKDNIINNNHNLLLKFRKELSGSNLINDMRKKNILYQKIKHNFNIDNLNLLPFITKNTLYNFNSGNNMNTNLENNFNIQLQNLDQLHENFINSFNNKNGLLSDIESDNENKIWKKKILKKNYSQGWILDKQIHSKISEKKVKSKIKEIIHKNRNNKVIKKSFSIENYNNDIKKLFDDKKIKITNKKNINVKKPQSEQKKISPIKDNYIFSNPIKNKNFSFLSSKNMKITKDNNNTESNKKTSSDNINNDINYKTSTYFFSPKFKKKYTKNSLNIKEIINNAIANNIKISQATMSSSFFNIGKDYFHNKSKKTQKNFYSYSQNKNWNKEKTDEEINKENNKQSEFNSLKLILSDFENWEKHENIWEDLTKDIKEKNEIDILPPNNEDILISSYIKMIGKGEKNEIISIKDNTVNIFINDSNIKNPRNEIKNWKNVYKNSILRWHPDKLFPLLTELNIKDENIVKDLYRRSTIIINNINNMYQNIMEILNKILLNKN